MPFWMKPSLWQHEVQDVLRIYPDAQWRRAIKDGVHARALHLTMNPIPDRDELPYILADLNVGSGVAIELQGKIGHSKSQCKIPIEHHSQLLPNIDIPQQTYVVDLVYQPPSKKATWSIPPRAFIRDPEISFRTYPNHPHMYVGNNESWACPLSPQDKRWRWGKGATVAYLDQLAIWLLKTAVWIATGAGIAGLGIWIGLDTSHTSLDLLKTVQLTDPCWCGSGLSYKECHFQLDTLRAIGKRISNS